MGTHKYSINMGIAVKFGINTTLVAQKIEISLTFTSWSFTHFQCNTYGIYPKFHCNPCYYYKFSKYKYNSNTLVREIYIHKAEILSVTLLTRLGLSTSPYQLPSIKRPFSSSFKFVTTSQCGDQLAFCSHLKTKKWRKLEQHSITNHSHIAQWVVQLTCIREVAGSNPGSEQFFSWISILFANTFLEFSFDNTVS